MQAALASSLASSQSGLALANSSMYHYTTTTTRNTWPWPLAPGTTVPPLQPGQVAPWPAGIPQYAPVAPSIVATPEELAEMQKQQFDMIIAQAVTPRDATARCRVCSALIVWAEGGWRLHRGNCMTALPVTDVDGI